MCPSSSAPMLLFHHVQAATALVRRSALNPAQFCLSFPKKAKHCDVCRPNALLATGICCPPVYCRRGYELLICGSRSRVQYKSYRWLLDPLCWDTGKVQKVLTMY